MRHKITKTGDQADPYGRYTQQSPTVKIEAVVKGVLTLMKDPNRNCKYIL